MSTTSERRATAVSPTTPQPDPQPQAAPLGAGLAAPAEATECPACGNQMRRWAGFYRCHGCGFKESCCF